MTFLIESGRFLSRYFPAGRELGAVSLRTIVAHQRGDVDLTHRFTLARFAARLRRLEKHPQTVACGCLRFAPALSLARHGALGEAARRVDAGA